MAVSNGLERDLDGRQVEVGWDDGEREPQLDQMLAEAEAEWETAAPSGLLDKGRTTIKAYLGVRVGCVGGVSSSKCSHRILVCLGHCGKRLAAPGVHRDLE